MTEAEDPFGKIQNMHITQAHARDREMDKDRERRKDRERDTDIKREEKDQVSNKQTGRRTERRRITVKVVHTHMFLFFDSEHGPIMQFASFQG